MFRTVTRFQVPPKKPQSTELGEQQLISRFCRENDLAISPENTKILRDGIAKEFDDYFSVENLRFVMRQHSTQFRRAVTIKTLPRVVSVEEMQSMLKMILSANSWIADTPRNGELIATTFLDDPRISPKRNLQDMIKAVEIVKNQLDRTPPPPPPARPQYEEPKPLESWQLPYPQSDWQLQRASREQVSDYVSRLRKREAWEAQQNS